MNLEHPKEAEKVTSINPPLAGDYLPAVTVSEPNDNRTDSGYGEIDAAGITVTVGHFPSIGYPYQSHCRAVG